jgi:hypothetical protein
MQREDAPSGAAGINIAPATSASSTRLQHAMRKKQALHARRLRTFAINALRAIDGASSSDASIAAIELSAPT